jgi:hypothetical protein
MEDVKKMLRVVINGQSIMKSELLGEISKVNQKVDLLEIKMDLGFKNVNDRLDKQGKALAYLEDDAPTREEFDRLEQKVASV